jgi:transcriptional regulator with XRE-family HTH domain
MSEIRTDQISEGARGAARRRWLLWGLAAALLGTPGVIGLLLLSTGRQKKVTNINRASFERITLGMSKEQVVDLLGAPPGYYTNGPRTLLACSAKNSTFPAPQLARTWSTCYYTAAGILICKCGRRIWRLFVRRKRSQPREAHSVAQRLRELLSEAGISQGELARRAGVSPQVVSRLLTEGNADMTLGIACRVCWAMGLGPDALAGAVFAEWQAEPGVVEWQNRELDRRRLQQKLEAMQQRIVDYQKHLPDGQDDAGRVPRRWAEGMIGHWQRQAKELEARLRKLG